MDGRPASNIKVGYVLKFVTETSYDFVNYKICIGILENGVQYWLLFTC